MESPYEVIYNKNPNNLGYDRNLKKIAELASGKYLMYMSDDDMFTPNVLDYVVEDFTGKNFGVYYNVEYNKSLRRYGRCYKDNEVINPRTDYLRRIL